MKSLAHSYDHDKFVNESTSEKFGLISKIRSFIKEKGFHHPDDFFRKTIANKGWWALCQPPSPAAISVVREFYANLASHVLKKVRVRGVIVQNFRMKFLLRRGECKTRENSNFLRKGKMVILVKIQKFSRSRMMKRTSPLESSRESSYHIDFRRIPR